MKIYHKKNFAAGLLMLGLGWRGCIWRNIHN